MFFNFYFIILMIRIFSDCKISYTFPIHKTLAEFFFAKAENVPKMCRRPQFSIACPQRLRGIYIIMCICNLGFI